LLGDFTVCDRATGQVTSARARWIAPALAESGAAGADFLIGAASDLDEAAQ